MKLLEQVYRNASSRDVIGPSMAEDLRQRTGVECPTIIRCAVEPAMLAKLPYPATPPEDDTIRIGYAGTVVAQEAFAAFVAGVKAARAKTKRKIEIHSIAGMPIATGRGSTPRSLSSTGRARRRRCTRNIAR